MKKPLLTAAALMLSPMAGLKAAELKVVAGGSLTAPLTKLAPDFEHSSGHTLVIHFDSTPNIIKQVTAGEPYDLGVVPVDVFKDAAAKARLMCSRMPPQRPASPRPRQTSRASAMASLCVPVLPSRMSARRRR
jgi:hypothetical protein